MLLSSSVRSICGSLAAASFLVALSAPPAAAQNDKKAAEKLEEAQRLEAQALVVMVDDLASGKPAQTALPFRWESQHFIKAQGDKTYVPFTIAFDPGALSSNSVGVYLRVMKRGAAPEPPPVAEPKKKDKDAKVEPRSHYPFEDLFFIDLTAAPAGQAQQLRRAFAVPPGEYDVYIAAKERPGTAAAAPAAGTAPPPAPPKMGVIKQALSVPDLATDLTTSSIIVAEKVEVLQAPLQNERQSDNPYTFGQMKITPAVDAKFSKKGEMSVVFWIYGAGTDPSTKKPDVNIDFKFYTKDKNGEFSYFNKTDPQALNAQTLPPQFDLTAGHQLPGSLAVPLASFPEGEYRLDIELTDKIASKTIKRDVGFTVVP